MSGLLNRPWVLFAPLPATAVGIVIAGAHGVSWVSYAPNLLGLLLGSGLFYVAQRVTGDKLTAWMPGVAAVAILATLLGPGIDGVYRWLSVGPLRLNASSAFAPWLLIGLSASRERPRMRAMVPVLVAQVAHVMQPDAGQATALAAALIPLLVNPSRIKPTIGIPLASAVTFLAAAAWLRHDPLPAVDHVERILVLASMTSVLLVVAVVLTGGGLLLPFVVPTETLLRGAVDQALACYFLASFVVPFVGNFPVPVFGAGAGPVLGWYALLSVRAIATQSAAP
ncbi:MAG TPA: hypothetical protein VH877_24025 [Polyangia bacterium]|nr:hypothetical protein [Polyangia bacterium]